MKAYPKPGRAIQLVVEDEDDWRLLMQLLMDASFDGFDPAMEVSTLMDDEGLKDDWNDFVLPDLRETLDASLSRVAQDIDVARQVHEAGEGMVLITADAGFDWYSVINRARLALESRHRLASHKKQPTSDVSLRSAILRDRLYCALQCLLLDHSLA